MIYVADVFPFYPPAVQEAAVAANRRKRQRKPGPSTPSPTRGWQLAAAAPHTKPKMDPPRHLQQSAGPAPLRRPASGWATARSPSLLPTRRVFRAIRWSLVSSGWVPRGRSRDVCDQLRLWLRCCLCLISCQWGQLLAWSECLPVCQTLRWSDGVICVRGEQFIKWKTSRTDSKCHHRLCGTFLVYFQTEYLPCCFNIFYYCHFKFS